jgi:transcriptional regulator with XRE-family HTH domain
MHTCVKGGVSGSLTRPAERSMGNRRAEPSGEHLELARVAREYVGDLTLHQMAQKTGVNRQSIANVLNGESVGPAMLIAFAAALGRPTNPLREAMNLPPIFPDPTASAATDRFAQLAEKLGVPVHELAEDMENAELMDAVKFVLDLRVRRSDLQRWQKNNSLYLGIREAIRLQQKARSKKPVRRPKPSDATPESES